MKRALPSTVRPLRHNGLAPVPRRFRVYRTATSQQTADFAILFIAHNNKSLVAPGILPGSAPDSHTD